MGWKSSILLSLSVFGALMLFSHKGAWGRKNLGYVNIGACNEACSSQGGLKLLEAYNQRYSCSCQSGHTTNLVRTDNP